jgi:hypothetical protein
LVKRVLWLLLVLGLAGQVDVGTFASFTAVTGNGASFATGSLVLTNKRNNATACASTSAAVTDVNDTNCDVLFTLLAQDGGSSNVRVTIKNEGSVDASSLTLHWANGTSPCVTVDEPTEQYHGTGDLCGILRLQVQEYPSAATQSGNDRGLDPVTGESSACWFGGGAGTDTCSFNNSQVMSTFSAYTGVGGDSIDMGPIAAGDTRYYRIYINVPAGKLTNAMQGRMVDFGFTWTAVS